MLISKVKFIDGVIDWQFSNDCQNKPIPNGITLTNHNRSKHHDEPIRIVKCTAKRERTRCDWFWFCSLLVQKPAENF